MTYSRHKLERLNSVSGFSCTLVFSPGWDLLVRAGWCAVSATGGSEMTQVQKRSWPKFEELKKHKEIKASHVSLYTFCTWALRQLKVWVLKLLHGTTRVTSNSSEHWASLRGVYNFWVAANGMVPCHAKPSLQKSWRESYWHPGCAMGKDWGKDGLLRSRKPEIMHPSFTDSSWLKLPPPLPVN